MSELKTVKVQNKAGATAIVNADEFKDGKHPALEGDDWAAAADGDAEAKAKAEAEAAALKAKAEEEAAAAAKHKK